MSEITIELDKKVFNILKKRARKSLLSPAELVKDVIRRSMLSYREDKSGIPKTNLDDNFVSIFSRERRGRKAKK